jgi:hypothetical protein
MFCFDFQLMKKANKRKEMETNLQEKRLHLSFDDERDFNKENDLKRFKDPYYDQTEYVFKNKGRNEVSMYALVYSQT